MDLLRYPWLCKNEIRLGVLMEHPYHKLIRQFFKLIGCIEEGKLNAFCVRKGLNYNTLKCWRNGRSNPSLRTFSEALDKSGYIIQIVKKEDMFKY